jgi:hypothetical protein
MRRLVDHDPITGITTWHEYDSLTKQTSIHTTFADAPIDAVLDLNHHLQNENDGWSPSKEWRRAGSIPIAVIHDWYVKEGIDVFNKDHWPAVRKKLNSSDFRKLRTALWTV